MLEMEREEESKRLKQQRITEEAEHKRLASEYTKREEKRIQREIEEKELKEAQALLQEAERRLQSRPSWNRLCMSNLKKGRTVCLKHFDGV